MRRRRETAVEPLEPRTLLAVVTVNAGQVVRAVNPHVIGVNLAWWDTQLPSARTKQMVQDAGLNFFRFPGGSSSDEYHFSDPPSYNGRGTAASFANFIASVGGQGVATLNYGTGSPQEAAAWLAYLNADPGNTTPIGPGPIWNATTSTWVQKDWKTAGFWASLRAAAPLGTDDGLNFLRVRRAAPFALHYFEVGNEEYGSWETDRHGQGGDTGLPHDPATYAKFARQFADYAAQIDPTISIGIDSGSVGTDNDWTARVLRAGQSLGFVPGFVSDHAYMQGPGSESDSFLLTQTVTGTGQSATDPHNWRTRATNYRALLNRNLGTAAASKVELLATEYNSVYSNPGKQTTSLVNGLFAADSIGSLLQTEYNGANFWDLRNGWDTANNNSASLYGWRQGGDYGMLGSGSGPAPSTGTYVPYPTYFAHQLASKAVLGGEAVVTAGTDNTLLSAYAVRQADGGLDLLVINKNPTADLTQQVQLQNYRAAPAAHVWQYGKAEDTAQSHTADGSAALTSTNATLALNGSSFNYTFPSYSMTVIELAPAAAAVAGRYTFYNHSALDGNNAGATAADDGAIAADKQALRPGDAATFANVTSYSRGINGVMVDVAALPLDRTPTAGDFVLETLKGSTWSPVSAAASVAVRRGAGTSGTDRVTLTLPDGAVNNTWLRVTVKPTVNTGLTQPDGFSFGNLVGETGSAPALSVNVNDLAETRANFGRITPAAVNRFDFNRDGVIDANDVVLVRLNLHRSLPPVAPAAVAESTFPTTPVAPATRAPTSPVRRSLWDEVTSAAT